MLKLMNRASERQLRTLRRLIDYGVVLAEHLNKLDPAGHEMEYLWDAIDDGVLMLKQLGGSPHLNTRRKVGAVAPASGELTTAL